MSASQASPVTDEWTFPIYLQGPNDTASSSELQKVVADSLQQIPGFQGVREGSDEGGGMFLASFTPGQQSRQAILDAIYAHGFKVEQTKTAQATATPTPS